MACAAASPSVVPSEKTMKFCVCPAFAWPSAAGCRRWWALSALADRVTPGGMKTRACTFEPKRLRSMADGDLRLFLRGAGGRGLDSKGDTDVLPLLTETAL